MFNTKHNKSIVILAAVCLCLVFVLTACANSATFKAVKVEAGEVSGNGGIAVRYGNNILYVNGYQSDATAANAYDNSIRVGQIVMISVDDLETAIGKKSEKGKSDSVISSEISVYIAEKAKVVVPNFYYSNNTTETGLNGIYIYNGSLYYTTPNDELTAGGEKLTSELVLKSVKLDGSQATPTVHHVFTSNSTAIMLGQVGNDVYAAYTQDSKLYTLKIGDKDATEIKNGEDELTLSNINYDKDEDGNYVGLFATDKDGNIVHYQLGATKVVKYVTNKKADEGKTANSLTIKSVNAGYVYYTKSIEGVSDGKVYYTNKAVEGEGADTVYCNSDISGIYSYADYKVYVNSNVESGITYYNIYRLQSADMSGEPVNLLRKVENVKSITIDRISGKYLYYTADSVNYKIDITEMTADVAEADKPKSGTVIGKSLSTTATGWSTPDALSFAIGGTTYNYVFTLASGSISVVKFDAAKVSNGSSVTITLVEQTDK